MDLYSLLIGCSSEWLVNRPDSSERSTDLRRFCGWTHYPRFLPLQRNLDHAEPLHSATPELSECLSNRKVIHRYKATKSVCSSLFPQFIHIRSDSITGMGNMRWITPLHMRYRTAVLKEPAPAVLVDTLGASTV